MQFDDSMVVYVFPLCSKCAVWLRQYCVFFFKQKTAYEMRISDWSSDVCSSDLLAGAPVPFAPWSMAPVSPFGVPQTLSAAFFGGLWGIAYAAADRKSVV